MTARTRRGVCAVFAALACLVPAAAASAQPASPVDAGTIRVVDERGRPLSGGGSKTKFTFALPADDAFCPGDSANDNYRVNSFMVPVAVAATEVSYDGLGPKPQHYETYDDFRMPLYDQYTSDYTSGLTAEQDEPGGPGTIVNIPMLWFGVYAGGELPTGRYRIGLACTLLNKIEKYWDTEIVVAADEDDEPARISWRRAGAAAPGGGASGSSPVVVAVLVAAVAGVLVLGARLRGRTPAPSSKELR